MLFIKGQICEAMGWTFLEFDLQPTNDVLAYWELRGLAEQYIRSRKEQNG